MRLVMGMLNRIGNSRGQTTRALAIHNALSRKKLLIEQGGPVDFWLAGWPDSPELWPNQDKILPLPQLPPLVPGTTTDLSQYVKLLCQGIYSLKADLLLCDTDPNPFLPLITDRAVRPKEVWAVVRYDNPFIWRNIPSRTFDRAYYIEKFDHWPQDYNGGICRTKIRSVYQKENGLDWKAEPEKYFSGKRDGLTWYERNGQTDRKLIPPVVNVDATKVLDKKDAREVLLKFANIEDTGLPVTLIIGGRALGSGGFAEWASNELLKLPDSHVVWARSNGQVLPELYRYMTGADSILATCGYNTFYELRYLWRDLRVIPLQTPIEFWPSGGLDTLRDGVQVPRLHGSEQAYRWHNRKLLFDFPISGNGADDLADLISRRVVD